MQYTYVEGNEELLEGICPVIKKSFEKGAEDIRKGLEEKARWGSMRIVIATNEGSEVDAVGIATVNNQNTGHVEYILSKDVLYKEQLEKDILDKLTKWLRWLKVKSISVEPRHGTY